MTDQAPNVRCRPCPLDRGAREARSASTAPLLSSAERAAALCLAVLLVLALAAMETWNLNPGLHRHLTAPGAHPIYGLPDAGSPPAPTDPD